MAWTTVGWSQVAQLSQRYFLNASDGYENFLIVESEIDSDVGRLVGKYVVGSLPPTPTFAERPTRYTEWKPLLLISLSFCVGIVLIWAPTKVK